MTRTQDARANRIDHENGIVEFVVENSSDASVREYLQLIHTRFEEVMAHPENQKIMLRHLHVIESMRLPSVVAIFRGFRDIYREYVHVPPARVVYLYQPGLVISMAKVFVKLLERIRSSPLAIRFMTIDQRAEAIQWLLSDE